MREPQFRYHSRRPFSRRPPDLDEQLSRVFGIWGLPFPGEMPRAKGAARTDRRPYWEVLEPDERDRISYVFAKEIEHFGYWHEPAAPLV